ncbi:MAG: hypothetical protein R3332_03675 [Pseudohongiellaceae bacterium]|nr:hypothetical protein [Pseudohongiellaceae bacterium]
MQFTKRLARTSITALSFLIWLFSIATYAQEEIGIAGTIVIQEVEYIQWSEPTPPPADAQWQPTSLPFNAGIGLSVNALTDNHREFMWFRFHLQKPSTPGRYGLYFWRYNLALNVFFNGSEIGGSTFKSGYETMSWNRPLLIEVQQAAWQEADNIVLLRLQRSPWGGNLAPVVAGDLAPLNKLYSERMFRQIEVNEILLTFGLSLTVLSFLLWSFRRNDSIYLWFSGLSFSWSIITTHMVVYYNPIPYAYWLPIVHVALDCSALCMYGFIGRLVTSAKKPRLERAFLIWTLLASCSHFLVPREYFWYSAYSIHLFGTLALAAIIIRVSFIAIQTKNRYAVIVSAAMFVQIALFIHNVYLLFSGSTAQWEGSMFYAHYGIPLLFIIFIATLIRRFVLALQTAETLNQELERKVAHSAKIIEKGYAERRALELSQAAEKERLKIYRDLHDDVGSKLLSIIHADRDNKFSSMARGALESLRHAVSKVNNPDQPIANFIQDIQEETELRLSGSGHQVSWTNHSEAPELIIPSTIAFNLNRILKEVVSNIIRHANAQEVAVDLHFDRSNWYILIQDDGKGFDPFGPMGNGVANMRSRAKEIGTQLNIESNFDTGTRISAKISLDGFIKQP